MTLPFERKNAVIRVKEFLYELLDPKKTPRIPSEIRTRAAKLLKHYPGIWEMEKAGRDAPDVFGDWKPGVDK